MAKADDLKIKIPLTPSQESFFPEIIKELNSDPTMMMGHFVLKNGSLEASCFDLHDLIEALYETAPTIEFQRFKKQARKALINLYTQTQSSHLRKNFQVAISLI